MYLNMLLNCNFFTNILEDNLLIYIKDLKCVHIPGPHSSTPLTLT